MWSHKHMPLAGWYAEPLTRERARRRLARARRCASTAAARGAEGWGCRLQEMIARFWLGHAVEGDYRSLAALAPSRRERALLDLVYGQLLMSRKLAGASARLDEGFRRAADLLEPAEYFRLLKRHELLRELPLSDTPSPPRGLDDLLREAEVIRLLAGRSASRHWNPCDTVG